MLSFPFRLALIYIHVFILMQLVLLQSVNLVFGADWCPRDKYNSIKYTNDKGEEQKCSVCEVMGKWKKEGCKCDATNLMGNKKCEKDESEWRKSFCSQCCASGEDMPKCKENAKPADADAKHAALMAQAEQQRNHNQIVKELEERQKLATSESKSSSTIELSVSKSSSASDFINFLTAHSCTIISFLVAILIVAVITFMIRLLVHNHMVSVTSESEGTAGIVAGIVAENGGVKNYNAVQGVKRGGIRKTKNKRGKKAGKA